MSIFVDFHILQTVPPSCVNRDDTGSPKTAVYGGTTRARVSSQAWKRAVREMFRELFTSEELGMRTKHVVDLVVQEIKAIDPAFDEEKAVKQAEKVLTAADIKPSGKKGSENTADALFFMSSAQAKALAALAIAGITDKKECKKALQENPSADIALFGRMLAAAPELNQDAAAQVAHAISTHTVHNEYDYFTAVDDCAPADNAGAAYLGTVEFNSSTLYRYATVNATELYRTTEDKTADVIRKFAEAFICSMPTGRQNSFANRTFPDAVYITIRSDQPVNLCGAFEKPVRAGSEGYVEGSAAALTAYAKKIYEYFAADPDFAFALGEAMQPLADTQPLPQMLDALSAQLADLLSDGASK